MRRLLSVLVALLAIAGCLSTNAFAAEDAPVPIYAKSEEDLKVEWIRRIWCGGRHNAFPDLERFNDRWYAATREGTAHGIAGFGKVRIIASDDGRQWKSVALFDGFGDYRRGELSITPDGRLVLVAKFNFYEKARPEETKPISAEDHDGKAHQVVTAGYENRVAFSKDGTTWTDMQPMKGTHPQAWFYSGVQWHDGVGYAIDRNGRRLYRTADGIQFEEVSDVPVGNESRISFLPDGTMVVFFRNGSLAKSPQPYTRWSLNKKNKKGPHSYGGPGIIALPNGEVWTASRHRIELGEFAYGEENPFPDGTALFKLDGEQLVPKLLIRGGGDRGYNGLVWHDGFLWMAYNAPSREADKSCIYLAKFKLP